jgi:hypothetical protein
MEQGDADPGTDEGADLQRAADQDDLGRRHALAYPTTSLPVQRLPRT